MSETTPKAPTNFVLRLSGQEMRCIDALPPGLLFDVAEVANTDERNPNDVLRTMATIGRFLKSIVIPEDRPIYDRIVYDTRDVIGIDVLSEEAGRLIQEYAGRPTSRPSASPDGSRQTEPSSRVVSFSRGTVEEEPPSGTDGASSES